MTSGQDHHKMLNALRMMRAEKQGQQRYNTKITAQVYESIKQEYAELQSKQLAYERLGFGLIDARERLKLIKKTESRFLIVTNNEKQSLNLNNLFYIYEDYIDSWKKADYQYVRAFLNNHNYKEVSEQFNINIFK